MNILIPRRLEDRQERLEKKLYKLFSQEEIIGNVKITFVFQMKNIKTKKIIGDVQLRNITKIPTFFKNIIIDGNFSCAFNNLRSIKNCPLYISGTFYCQYNKLDNLNGCPKRVDGAFWAFGNNIKFSKSDILEKCNVHAGFIHL